MALGIEVFVRRVLERARRVVGNNGVAPLSAMACLKAPQFAILTACLVVIEAGWYVAYAAAGRRPAGWLASAKRRRLFDRATGSLFLLFGAGLIVARA